MKNAEIGKKCHLNRTLLNPTQYTNVFLYDRDGYWVKVRLLRVFIFYLFSLFNRRIFLCRF